MALATVLLDLATQYDTWLIHLVDFGKMICMGLHAEHEKYLKGGEHSFSRATLLFKSSDTEILLTGLVRYNISLVIHVSKSDGMLDSEKRN